MNFLPLDHPSLTHSQPDHFFMPPIDAPSSHQDNSKLEKNRCYWTLLSAELQFLYVSPVFQERLGPQANVIIGKKLLEFVHPDEHASAQQDLGKVLESRTLHGSVTRVRYSRLGRLRALLGYTGIHDKFADEDKVSFDEDYMACDLVINWAAEGLVLCFIHAVVDISPQDNDEINRTHWTNWCGTPSMTVEHGNDLYHSLLHISSHISQGGPSPTRVFQILHNSIDRPTLFSWPCEGYIPADYGRLACDVQIGGANGSDAKTSCTRRYKAQQLLDSADGSVRDVESIFIPHEKIIFACHKATLYRSQRHPNSYPLYPTPAQFYDAPGHAHTSYYPPVPVPSQADPYQGQGGNTYSHFSQPPHPHAQPAQVHPHQSSLSAPSPSSPLFNRGTGSQSPYHRQQTQTEWPLSNAPQPSSYIEHSQNQSYPLLDEVPPPRQRAGRLSPEASASPGGSTRDVYPGGGRAGGNPPVGVNCCAACKSTSSPEWRKGPSGRKDLCNACGLRYSRARAKKEGIVSQKRRKDTGKVQTQPPTQRSSPPIKRRGYGSSGYPNHPLDEQFPMGSGSGEGSTPSPSPPQDYPPTHSQQQHTPSNSRSYSYVSPIDPRHQMYLGQSHHHYSTQPQHHHANGFLAPTPSPAPGVSGSGETAAITPASSYERAGLPPTSRTTLQNQHKNVHS